MRQLTAQEKETISSIAENAGWDSWQDEDSWLTFFDTKNGDPYTLYFSWNSECCEEKDVDMGDLVGTLTKQLKKFLRTDRQTAFTIQLSFHCRQCPDYIGRIKELCDAFKKASKQNQA